MSMTVITYGGGEILKNIFESVAMLLNGQNGSLLRPILTITLSIGALWSVSKAFLTQSHQAFLGQFILPVLAICGLLLIPSGSVHIEDVLKHRAYKVDHVPLMVARFAEIASTIGYKITVAVEKVMHVPNDLSYNATGMVFGADTALDISRYRISNADLDQNLRRFCKQCVLYDVSLGRYTIDEVKKATDLWQFFEQKTSKVGMMTYLPIGEEGRRKPEYLSCRNAIKKMRPYLEEEKKYFGQLDVIKNLPLTFQALTGIQKEKEELISQQLMINLLGSEFEKKSFATNRAASQQRSTYQILGSLASSSLVTLRAVLEALIYASCIFILPLSVLPGGVKYLMTWAGLVLWIQMWPPFYAILNYIMQSVAVGYADSVFHGLSGDQQGLSLFTSIGLNNLQEDVYALSGYIAASIPFITYAILKGGVGSFVHLAGSMMSPAQSAATTAAGEQTTGNYSFGNASMGQTSYQNSSAFQTNTAPSLSTGFFQENRGDHSITYGAQEQILKQSSSDLRTSLFSDDSISQTLQQTKMHAESLTETAQNSYADSITAHARHMADLTEHLSKSDSFSEGISTKEAFDLQESARYFKNTAESLGKQEGIGTREAMEQMMGLGWDIGVTAKTCTNLGSSKDHSLHEARNVATGEEFQQHYQRVQDFLQSSASSSLDEKGERLMEGYSQSLENVQNSQESYQLAQSKLDQISENATWSEQNSHLIKRSLNQDFINWSSDAYSDRGGFSYVESLLRKGNIAEQEELVTEFITHIREKQASLSISENYVDPSIARTLPKELSASVVANAMQENLSHHKQRFSSSVDKNSSDLSHQFKNIARSRGDAIQNSSEKIENTHHSFTESFKEKAEQPLAQQAVMQVFDTVKSAQKSIPEMTQIVVNKMSKQFEKQDPELVNNFQITETPFWKEVR